MVQGTAEWIEWRKKGIGASEMAAILGICPYSTPYKVWLEKTGKAQGFVGNFATQRGTELEAKVRARYELVSMEDMPPACAVHPKFDIVRVSLDGLRSDGKKILEIKCLGKEFHSMAMADKVPPHYIPQIQYQMAATGADSCDFFSFGTDETHALIEVQADVEYQGMLIAKALEFWKLVESNSPPPLSKEDDKIIEGGKVAEICEFIIKNKEKITKEQLEGLKFNILEAGNHNRVRCGRVLITLSDKGTARMTIAKEKEI